ncbi:MAG: hypothetical protein EXS13_01535 [Planctomycetes bacterium]|nr:hypothetical protein [Planctomycetota bacterium]
MFRRILIAVLGPAALLMFAAGGYTLLTGRAPRALFRRPLAVPRTPLAVMPPAPELGTVRGFYQAHVDPLVGYTLRPSTTLTIGGVAVESDELGLRRRAGPAPSARARTLIILGDSLAFGFGLDDASCLGQQLEGLLAHARGDEAAPAWIVRTVAIPGWNWRNAWSFLRDHRDRLAPSIVVFLPIDNDLSDTEGLADRGRRRLVPDVASSNPWVAISMNRVQERLLALAGRVEAGELSIGEEQVGLIALNADLGGEPSRRYDAMARAIGEFDAELGTVSVRFAVASYIDSRFNHALLARVVELRPELPLVPLLRSVEPADVLPDDPHPNSTTVGMLARWLAQELTTTLRWIESVAPITDVPPSFTERRAPRRDAAEFARLAAAARSANVAALRAVIAPPRGEGMNQVVGGLSPAGFMGPRLHALLPRAAPLIEVALAPIDGRDDLLPLRIQVEIDGAPLGQLELPAGGRDIVRRRFALPPAATGRGAAAVEIELIASRCVAMADGRSFDLASCRVEELALVE